MVGTHVAVVADVEEGEVLTVDVGHLRQTPSGLRQPCPALARKLASTETVTCFRGCWYVVRDAVQGSLCWLQL
eukprot:1184599-Prorocentrum_minimum.AAC.11